MIWKVPDEHVLQFDQIQNSSGWTADRKGENDDKKYSEKKFKMTSHIILKKNIFKLLAIS